MLPLSALQLLFLTILIGWYIISYCRSSLRKVPGPWHASLTNLDRVWSTLKGSQHAYHLALHGKYGPVVRLGPNCVSVAHHEQVSAIYGLSGTFRKSNLYTVFDPQPGVSNMFTVLDEGQHKAMSRQLGSAFSLSTMRELEPLNDVCTAIIVKKFEDAAKAGKIVKMHEWMQWYAFDVITELTFSKRLGFMDREEDVNGLMQVNYRRLQYATTVGQVPWVHKYLLGNPLLAPMLAKFDKANIIVQFALQQVQRYGSKGAEAHGHRDLLDRLKRIEGNTDEDLLVHATNSLFAGGDTTGITLTAIFYHLMRNPRAYRALQTEIDKADAGSQLSHPVTFAEAQDLHYLQAVIKETLRIHPAVGALLERVVPQGGVAIDGLTLPEGTIIGMDPWVSARNPYIYPVPDKFRPERWLEADAEKLKRMEKSVLTFGSGSRICTGKAIALLEISKIVPELLRKFDFELVHPEREWKLKSYFFVWPTGVECRLKLRE